MSYQYNMTGGASAEQIGQAAALRYQEHITPEVRQQLHQVVHSADPAGPFADRPNQYRDLTMTYDQNVQDLLDANQR